MENCMYYLKPTCPLDGPPISYPSCMYSLPDPQGNNLETDLSQRQDELIGKLSNLLTSADQIAKNKGVCVPVDRSMFSNAPLVNGFNSQAKSAINVAVHADPRKPPFSLFMILHYMRAKGSSISLNCHIHSSLTNIRESILRMNRLNDLISSPEAPKSQYDYIVNVIWKEQPLSGECQAISNNYKRHPLIGELILARTLWKEHLSNEELAFLDLIDQELLLGSKKEQTVALNKIAGGIDFVKKSTPLITILLLSGLHQHGLLTKALTPSINGWLNKFFEKHPYLPQVFS